MPETILVVDDEDSVRQTFRDWLMEANLGCTIVAAADTEEALRHAQQSTIDLAVLDWNLGTGMDGLRLLEDLAVFCPDIVAILVTGYAHQATPLMALRMGVRDYLDKNQELNRESLVDSVRRQLEKIVPAKRHRELHQSLAAFRAAVEQIVPLVQSSAALTQSMSLPRAVSALCEFLRSSIGASGAVLYARRQDESGETTRAFSASGEQLTGQMAPFQRSLAASAISLGEACVVNNIAPENLSGIELHEFETNRKNVLIVPLDAGAGISAVLELFDKANGFSDEDRRLTSAAAEIGGELVKQAIADRHERRTLFAAVEAALLATQHFDSRATPAIPASVRESLRTELDRPGQVVSGGAALELAEAVQKLAARHGESAVRHCQKLVSELSQLLDEVTGA